MSRFVFTLLLILSIGCEANSQDNFNNLAQIEEMVSSDELAKAILQGEKYVENHPASSTGWRVLGTAYMENEQFDKAKDCYEKAMKIDPRNDNVYVCYGIMCRKMDDNKNARIWYEKALEILPDNPEALASLLVIELIEGNDEQAVKYGERAWKLDEKNPIIAANLSVVYHYLDNVKMRDTYFDHAARLGYRNPEKLQSIFKGEISVR